MTISRRSAKAKGRKLESTIVEKLLETFPELSPEDIQKVAASCSGEDIILSDKAKELLDISIEAKARKSMAVYAYHKQCVKNAGERNPVTVIKADRQKPLAIIELDYFLMLLKNNLDNSE